MKLEILQKAFVVYHQGMLSHNPNDGYTDIDNIECVFAKTSGQAKTMGECYDYDIHGGEPTYLDIKVRRRKSDDIVIFEGARRRRDYVDSTIRDRKEIETRLGKLRKHPEDTMFYLQDSRNYVGNAMLLWGKNSAGYVCDIKEAGKYTREYMIDKVTRGMRDTDVIWPVDHLDTCLKQIVESQYVKRNLSI